MSEYHQTIIDRGGGIITLGNWLGVMVAPAECAKDCPAGWGFVDIATATPEIIAAACEEVPKRVNEFRAGLEKETKKGRK